MSAEVFETIRRCSLLEGCKWDAQVGDTTALAPFPLILRANTAQQLATWAEALSAEAFTAEEEILRRPQLLSELGLPAPLRNALAGSGELTPAAVRTIRFDFHLTADGWRISRPTFARSVCLNRASSVQMAFGRDSMSSFATPDWTRT